MKKTLTAVLVASTIGAGPAHAEDVWFQANVVHVSYGIVPVATFHSRGVGSSERNLMACKTFVNAFLAKVRPTEYTLACMESNRQPPTQEEVHIR